jgi:hypothetical protein
MKRGMDTWEWHGFNRNECIERTIIDHDRIGLVWFWARNIGLAYCDDESSVTLSPKSCFMFSLNICILGGAKLCGDVSQVSSS